MNGNETHSFTYFRDPRFAMSLPGRFFVRVGSSAGYALSIALAFTLMLSDLDSLRAAGILLAFFLFDQAFRIGLPEKSLHEWRGGRTNVAYYFTPTAIRVLEAASQRARMRQAHFPLLLLAFLIERREIKQVLARMEISQSRFEEALNVALCEAGSFLPVPNEVAFLAVNAFEIAVKNGSRGVEPKDVFAALVSLREAHLIRLFMQFEIQDEDLENALLFAHRTRRWTPLVRLRHLFGEPKKIRHRIMNRAWSARPTPILDRLSEDMTDLVREGGAGMAAGHDREYRELLDVLIKPQNAHALLVGDPGIGKRAILRRLAFDIVRDRVPPELFDRRIVELSIGTLVAGADQGEIESRVRRIVDEIITAGNVILYIPEIHNLTRTGREVMSAADILLPAMKHGKFSVIGATYPREFRQYLEPMSEIASNFQVIRVEEISEGDAARFLVYESMFLEKE